MIIEMRMNRWPAATRKVRSDESKKIVRIIPQKKINLVPGQDILVLEELKGPLPWPNLLDHTSLWVFQTFTSKHTSLWVFNQVYGWLHKSMSDLKVYEWAPKFMNVHRSLWIIEQVYEWSHKSMGDPKVYEWAHKFMNVHRSLGIIEQVYGSIHKSMSDPKVYEWAQKLVSVHRSLRVIKQVYEWSHKFMSLRVHHPYSLQNDDIFK